MTGSASKFAVPNTAAPAAQLHFHLPCWHDCRPGRHCGLRCWLSLQQGALSMCMLTAVGPTECVRAHCPPVGPTEHVYTDCQPHSPTEYVHAHCPPVGPSMSTLLLSSSTSSKSSGSCCSLLLPASHSLSCWPMPLLLATWGLKAPCASSGLHSCKGRLPFGRDARRQGQVLVAAWGLQAPCASSGLATSTQR